MDDVIYINQRATGTNALPRDENLLIAAIGRATVTMFGKDLYPDLVDKAAAILHSITKNHPFIDGNKRTAWISAATFLTSNGIKVTVSQDDVVAFMVEIANSKLEVSDIATQLKKWQS